jgi:mannose-6-phosphate isomerase
LSDARTVLTVNPHFVLEQIHLDPGSVWMFDAPKETWVLAIEGHAQLGSTRLSLGDAFFLEADHAEIEAGADGLKALLAYPGPTINPDALTRSAAGVNRARHAASCAPLAPAPLAQASLKQSGTSNWQS